MSVLLFAEHTDGGFKKSVLEAATYAYDLAQKMGVDVHAVSMGPIEEEELKSLGNYGIKTVHSVQSEQADSFINTAYASALAQVATKIDAQVIILAETYIGRAIASRVAVKLEATPLPGVISMVDPANQFDVTRMAYSGKGVQEIKSETDKVVITVKNNSYQVVEHEVDLTIVPFEFDLEAMSIDAVAKEIVKVSDGIVLTEADIVVSAGRGMKGPDNWKMIEELAELLNAATACSKPVSDMEWRPHHEHVGQTGIQISPNVYIAIGISGAIQHLAGVSSSKHIIVINKDPEAPFFKIADYGIVGDLFEVVPQLIDSIKTAKASV